MLRRAFTSITLVVAFAVAGGCAGDEPETAARKGSQVMEDLAGQSIRVRNDPGCSCCVSWVEYLERHGADVELSDDPERDSFRAELGISDDAASCHTAIVGGYAIEGHVPVGAIQRLLADRPDAVGLALPGMPGDGPGMGGDKSTWEAQPVMLVGRGGALTAFQY